MKEYKSGINFLPGTHLVLNHRKKRVIRTISKSKIQLEDCITREIQTHNLEELIGLFFADKLFCESLASSNLKSLSAVSHGKSFGALPEVQQKKALKIRKLISKIEKETSFISPKSIQPIIAEYCRELDISPSLSSFQAYRFLKAWKESGGNMLALVPRTIFRRSRNRTSSTVIDIIDEAIEEFYLTPERHSAQNVHLIICKKVEDLNQQGNNFPFPSLSTIYRKIRRLDSSMVKRSRFGLIAAKLDFDPVLKPPPTTFPLESIEIDHTPLDIFVWDQSKHVLARPTLTIALDRYSRMVVGYYLGFEEPSSSSLMQCLKMSIQPKSQHLSRFPKVKSSWPCFGLFFGIVADNGNEFHSKEFEDACIRLGINITYCPRRSPRHKGAVERFFGRLNSQLIHFLPGTTFSNPKDKGDYPSTKKAVLSIDDLESLFVQWLVEVYFRQPHRGLSKQSPIDKWNDSFDVEHVNLPSHPEELDCLLGCIDERTLKRTGIEINCLFYNSEELNNLYRSHLKDTKVTVKYNPMDIGVIHVLDEKNSRFIKVPALLFEYANGRSLHNHQINNRVLSQNNLDKNSLVDWQRVAVEIITQARQFSNKSKPKPNKKIARYNEGHPSNETKPTPKGKPLIIDEPPSLEELLQYGSEREWHAVKTKNSPESD